MIVPMTRRQFLHGAATMPLVAVVAPSHAEQLDSEKNMPVVDTHVHCFAGPADERFPYHPAGPYQPTQAATPEHLLSLMDTAGVDYAVIVHPEPYGDDHRYLEHCLTVGAGRLKGTCLFFADRPGSTDRLMELAKRAPVVAARVHAYVPDRLPPFDRPEMKQLWRAAADAGLAMQLHFEPRYASGFEPYLREFSSVTVLIDHLGRPFQGTRAEHAVVMKWASLPNTVMKLSSLPAQHEYPHRDVAPVIQSLFAAYGSERLMYGGGYGYDATADSYRATRERIAAILKDADDAAMSNILGGNAERLLGFSQA